MPVEVRDNPFHPARDVLVLREPWTVRQVRAAAEANGRPVASKAVPGSSGHARLLAAGARVYQQCPPLQLKAGTDAVTRWCEAHATLAVRDLVGADVAGLWASWYEVIHRGWAPAAPSAILRELFTGFVSQIDARRSVACSVDGDVVAVAFVFPGDQPPEILTEALRPEHPAARAAVASCMAATLRQSSGTVRFDGHVTDPHFAPLWATVPGVYAGEDDPLDLLEIAR